MTLASQMSRMTGSSVELMISCTDLADLDQFTKSDPMCVLFFKQFGQWQEYGRTEAIRDTLNPKFVETFVLDFDPEVPLSLMFSVYDIDCRSTDLKHHDYVGSVEVQLLELMSAQSKIHTTCKTLRIAGDSRARGIISITSEVLTDTTDRISLHAGGHKLGKHGKILTSKPDVYLEIGRSIDNIAYHPVYRSETILRTRHPRWRPFELSMLRLCNGDWDRLLEFSCWHYSGKGDYKLIGRKVTTVRELRLMKMEGNFKELNLVPKKKGDQNKGSIKITSRGYIRIYNFRVHCQYSLLDYVRGGMQLHPIIAIDFTSSNGRLDECFSLHNLTDLMGNRYIDVIESVGSMVAQYNSEQKIALLGFGAKVDNSRRTSHCFPLTGNWSNIYVTGIKNAIHQYKLNAEMVQFAGPSKLKPVIALAESLAVTEPTQNQQFYHVLIIITDGIINDIDDTIERLISITHLPLSVLFIGVGPSDFSLMEEFDYHNIEMLSMNNRRVVANRKNTHFVANRSSTGQTPSIDLLKRETFAVLSSQIVDYMKNRDIPPNKPTLTSKQSSVADISGIVKRKSFTARPLTRNSSTQSLNSVRHLCISGPKCPACGSALDIGTSLHTEVGKVE